MPSGQNTVLSCNALDATISLGRTTAHVYRALKNPRLLGSVVCSGHALRTAAADATWEFTTGKFGAAFRRAFRQKPGKGLVGTFCTSRSFRLAAVSSGLENLIGLTLANPDRASEPYRPSLQAASWSVHVRACVRPVHRAGGHLPVHGTQPTGK